MDDVEDLLASRALGGQDGARREDLEGQGKGNMIRQSNPPVYTVQLLQWRRWEFVVTMEPIDCTAEGMGVADRLGWVTTQLGAGLTVVLVVEAGSEEERGLLSDRSTGSVWSSAGHGWGEEGSVLQTGSIFTFRSVGCEQSSPTSAC